MLPWPGRTLLVTLLFLAPTRATEPVPLPSPDAVVARLGSAEFADREAAQAELLARGPDPAALLALGRAAAGSDDAEVRQRAAGILDALTRHAEGAKLLKPRAVALNFRAVPLDQAVAALRKSTGANLQLDPTRVADRHRLVSVTTGEVPAWEAVEQFRRAAGLVELFREDAPIATAGADAAMPSVRRSYYGGAPGPATTANLVPVAWADAGATTAAPLVADRTGPVRVTALPGRFALNRVVRGSGQVLIHLDVAPPADLLWEQTREVRILRAEDDTTRPVTIAHPLPTPLAAIPNELMFLGGFGFVNFDYPNGNPAADRGNPRLVPLALKTDDRLVRTLRVLEGVIVGTASLPNQTVISVDDLAKAAGVAHDGPGDTKLTVQNFHVGPDGKATLKVVVEGPNPYNQMRQGRRSVIASLWDEGGLGNAGLKNYRFTDADGKPVTAQVGSTNASDDGSRQTATLEMTFPPRVGSTKPPARLVVLGSRPVTLAVPFKLRDVPMP